MLEAQQRWHETWFEMSCALFSTLRSPLAADITLLSSSQGSKADSFLINHHLTLCIFSSAKVRLQGSHKQS